MTCFTLAGKLARSLSEEPTNSTGFRGGGDDGAGGADGASSNAEPL
jgi:hypothetical protein